MKTIFLLMFFLSIITPFTWGSSFLLKDEQRKCSQLGGEVLEPSNYFFSRAFCGGSWTFWLAKGADSGTAVVVDKVTLPPLRESEKLDDSLYCYFKGSRNKRLIFYGVFDFKLKGSVKNLQGKLVKAYIPDPKKEKLVALPLDSMDKVVCESEAEGD